MAVAAAAQTQEIYTEQYFEAVPHTYERPLRLVDQPLLDAAALLGHVGQQSWLSADDLPSVRMDRLHCDVESKTIIEDRMSLLREGRGDEVPYAFNVLATANKLIEAEDKYGAYSQEYLQHLKGLELDTTRHIAEAERRLTYMYAPETEQQYNADLDSYVYEQYVLDDVVTQGLTPVGAELVGIDVLIADRREEFTAKSVGKLGQLMLAQSGVRKPQFEMTMLTISQVDNSPQTMIRSLRFDPVRGSRFQEQVGFIKDHITPEVIVEGLRRKRAIEPDAMPGTTEVLGTQVISMQGETALSFMPLLDTIASERSGKNIFMGEEVATDQPKDYGAIPAEAAAREVRQQNEAKALLTKVVQLARQGVDGWFANTLVDKFVTDMLLDKVSEDPAAARNIFGEKTAQTIEESMYLRERGDIDGANQMLDQARVEAPPATVCTGGSCGLEGVDEKTRLGTIKEVGGKEGDTVLKDNVRSCPGCGQKKLIYVFNTKEVRTKCLGCKEDNFKKTA